MLNQSPWKVTLVLLVCLAGLIFSFPNLFSRATVDQWPGFLPKGQINLGLDLQGGAYLLLEVDSNAVIKDRMDELTNEVRVALRGAGVGYQGLGVVGDAVAFRLTDPGQREAALEAIRPLNVASGTGAGLSMFAPGTLSGGMELATEEPGDGRIVLRLSEAGRSARLTAAISQSLEIVRRRIDELGTREASVQRQGENRIVVQVPGESSPEAIKRLLGQTAKLTFHIVDLDTPLEVARAGGLPPGSMLLGSDEMGPNGQPLQYVVRRQVVVGGESLVDAQPTLQNNQPAVSFRFDSAGGRKFGQATQQNVGQLLAIVLDDKVISAPRVNEPILGGSGIISGNFTFQTATELAVLLRAGALPAPLEVIEERSVGPELGADSIRSGVLACIVAGIAVFIFMLVYYGPVFGLIANLALVVNLVLVFAVMSFLGATLTLPGIAGIVLVIGQAVDSNVLIYERIHEEVKNGRSPIASLDVGFNEAMRTIVDSNVTSFIAGIALFIFGTGPVKGFAVTHCIGIITTMFTAVTFTRMVVAYWYKWRRPRAIPL
ncbi:MAG TPA: protein translocase subunit SecD [Geminicoccus sp.]|uniref:protein translocase subunit SecD n=1 Tax=Geminicoccus sp. TaxID=2024832 RepID=UPI002E312C33|nr:protein translocase subunit SecD [Geminicoccus sp.]HEX2529187.1 protein translocase subunit SecD [Geminicoccus sp.]